jgi:hypothetical protein
MSHPLMIDLCCGNGGWTKGFLAEGWDCIGYDIEPQPNYPGRFVQRSILDLKVWELELADFICVSTPCQQFSRFQMRNFFPNPPHPGEGIKLFYHALRICEESGVLFIVENVRAAQQFVGKSITHCGPFYFWGNAVPAIFPLDCRKVSKGFKTGWLPKKKRESMTREEIIAHRRENSSPARWVHSKSAARREWTAKFSEIPFCISSFIARQFYVDRPITRSPDHPMPSEVSA